MVLSLIKWKVQEPKERFSSFLSENGQPRRIQLKCLDSKMISSFLGGQHHGESLPVDYFASSIEKCVNFSVAYLSDANYAGFLADKTLTVITTKQISAVVPDSCTVIIVDHEPRGEWARSINKFKDLRETFPTFQSSSSSVERTADVGAEVYLADNVHVSAHSVLRGPLYVGPNTFIGPGAVIGGDGFESVMSRNERIIVAHLGGTWIMNDVVIQAKCTIDKALDGSYTFIDCGVTMDNQVHIGHAVSIGKYTTLAACAEVSGSVQIGENVKIQPNAAIANGIVLGENSQIGIGAVALRDVLPYEVIVGHHRSLGIRA
jgi:UDP-3-O-[3-hydroxymyristoyl] glucosamine N-acyltransferase